MTGYGRGSDERGDARAEVEIRAVNHRFLDLKLRGSALDPALEEQLTRRARAALERGAVTVTVRIAMRGAAVPIAVDRDAGRKVQRELTELARALGIAPSAIGIDLVCAQPGVLVQVEDAPSEDAGACVLSATDAALASLVAMREAEGARLRVDLEARLAQLGALVETAGALAKRAPDNAAVRLRERIARLLESTGVEVDDERLAHEIAILADRLDVTEEAVRLRSHIEQLGAVMARTGAIGRRMDFVVQEIGRELNTLTSKSQSAEIATAMVEARAELEKIREQVQNIE